jgi:hypothetical protein
MQFIAESSNIQVTHYDIEIKSSSFKIESLYKVRHVDAIRTFESQAQRNADCDTLNEIKNLQLINTVFGSGR